MMTGYMQEQHILVHISGNSFLGKKSDIFLLLSGENEAAHRWLQIPRTIAATRAIVLETPRARKISGA